MPENNKSTLQNLLALDARLTKRMGIAEKPGPLRTAAAFFAHSGDSWFWLAALALVWWQGSRTWQANALTLIIWIFVTAVLVQVMKFLIRRPRPAGEWGDIYRKTDPHSFPSGHSTRAFMLGVMALGLGPPWFGVIVAIWAPLVALARVAMGVHYISDIAAGAVLGIFLGALGLWAAALLPLG